MSILLWVLLVLAVVVLLFAMQSIHLAAVLKWEDDKTNGLGYYGLPPDERRRFKRSLRRHAAVLFPILRLNTSLAKLDFRRARFQYRGISGPPGSCSAATFERGAAYQPSSDDVFIATQMKCGTTWMQHVVYQVLHRGQGNLVETGTTMYSVSPWLEGRKSVPVDQAPRLGGERPSRIIKTHLPAQLCPASADARFIYVARHPVSCFASCIDFVATNVGAMTPGIGAFEEWFCSPELMWWGTWTDHVGGWWDRARGDPHTLFVSFEDMKRDLPSIVRRVTSFLDLEPLTEPELERVAAKCRFDYMQRHQDVFEMHPPHILQTDAALFVRGSADRHKDVPEDVRQRILAWSAVHLAAGDFPLEAVYPDVAAAALVRP